MSLEEIRSSSSEHGEHAHPGGARIRVYGPTAESVFEEAARGLAASITDLRIVRAIEAVHFELQGGDLAQLFACWLDALLHEMSSRGLILGRFLVRVDGDQLTARAWGESLDRLRHLPARPLGGRVAEVSLVQQDGLWRAECVVTAEPPAGADGPARPRRS